MFDKKSFSDRFDFIQVFAKPAREDKGEDCFYCAKSKHSSLVSVCDGCGGLGAKKYDSYQGHTGAYIASRIVSGAIHDWYHDHSRQMWKSAKDLADSVDNYIRKAYAICDTYGIDKSRIMGSMVRKFPTTLALAYAECDGDDILLHLLWAGDSRIYLLDQNGLAQMTKDDTDVDDALENIYEDGVMDNVLSSDGNYTLNYKTLRLNHPALIFAATDGCFSYVTSPMEFEYIILKSLMDHENPYNFKKSLRQILSGYAGDDITCGIMSFYFDSYENTKQSLYARFNHMEKNYMVPMRKERSNIFTRELWNRYRSNYERFLK